jgi:DNA polymerase-1
MSKLLIIDGHAVIHRAYHSIPNLTVNGQPVNALYGFYSMLLSAISQINPKYLIVCLDSPALLSDSRNLLVIGPSVKLLTVI